MTVAQRTALLSALRAMGEMEFWADRIENPQARVMFEGHEGVFAGYAAALDKVRPAGPVPFVYLGGSYLNARAFRQDEHEFIGINWGAVVVVHDIFFRMLAAPSVLPHIGDTRLESDSERLPRLELDAARLPSSDGHPFAMDVSPQGPVRAFYAMNLAQIALDFLFIHEHQHVAGGHLSFLAGASAIEEMGMPADDIFTRHVLEMEADAAAANFSLGIACDMKGNAWRIDPVLAPALGTLRARQDAWLFAIWTLFFLMEGAANRAFFEGRPLPLSHPASIRRRAFLAIHVFQRRAQLRFDKAMKRAAGAFVAVHRAMMAIAEGQEQVLIGVDLIGRDHADDLERLVSRWRELHPRLAEQAARNGANSAPLDVIEGCRSL